MRHVIQYLLGGHVHESILRLRYACLKFILGHILVLRQFLEAVLIYLPLLILSLPQETS